MRTDDTYNCCSTCHLQFLPLCTAFSDHFLLCFFVFFSIAYLQLKETKQDRKWTLRKLDASEAAKAQLSAAEQSAHDADYEVHSLLNVLVLLLVHFN